MSKIFRVSGFGVAVALLVPLLAKGLPGKDFPVSLAISPEGGQAIVGHNNRAVELYALPGMNLIRALESPVGAFVRWHPTAHRVALFTGQLFVYDTQNWKVIHHDAAPLLDVCFLPDEEAIVGMYEAGENRYALHRIGLEQSPVPETFVIEAREPNRLLALGQSRVALFSSTGEVSVWSLRTQKMLARSQVNGLRGLLAVDAHPNQERLAWLSNETGEAGVLRGYDLRELAHFKAHDPYLGESVRISPDGEWVVTGGEYPESRVQAWKVSTSQKVGQRENLRVTDLAFSPDGKVLYVAEQLKERPHSISLTELIPEKNHTTESATTQPAWGVP